MTDKLALLLAQIAEAAGNGNRVRLRELAAQARALADRPTDPADPPESADA